MKEIPQFPGYAVSTDGFVWSCRKSKKNPFGKSWHKMRIGLTSNGYCACTFRCEGRDVRRTFHRILLELFVGPCPLGCETCHNNGIKSDNRLCNLRWDTKKANMRDRDLHGKTRKGIKHANAKFTEEFVMQLRQECVLGCRKRGTEALARKYKLTPSVVHSIVTGKSWKHLPLIIKGTA